jgi:hypothetical protein
MANTTIQLKFSNVTATPPSLNVAEPAYSYASNTFFIGSPSGTGVIAIGGKFYLDQQQDIYNLSNASFNHANAAFNAANTAADTWVRGQANAAFNQANAAYNAANTADNKATSAGVYANGAFSAANSAASAASSAQGTADAALSAAGAAQNSADAAFSAANGAIAVNLTQNTSITAAFAAANTADSKAVSAGSYANSAFAAANNEAGVNATQNNSIVTASNTANAAFFRANNALNANTGGTITGDVSITGNLSVLGNTFTVSATTIVANDTVIILGANNYTSDILDIGFAGHYNDGVNAHAGFIRDSGTKEWQLFEGYVPEIGANNNININDPSFKIATLNANVHATLIQLKGINLLPYVNGVYDAANTADAKAVTAGSYANSAFIRANNSLNANTGGSVSGTILSTANVRADYVVANTGFASAGGLSRLQLSDIGIVAVQVASQEFKFGASGIESSPGIFGGAFGGNKLLLNNQTILVSDRFDLVKIQTGEDGTVKNEFSFANNAFIAPGEITAGSVVAGGINVVPTLAASSNTANAAFDAANGAVAVNTTQNNSISAAFNHANAAFNTANTDVTNVSITAANYGTASAVASFRVEANGRITSANNTAIAIDAGAITSGTLPVSRGGSGAGTFTTNGVLLGQGTSAFSTASSSTEGHVLTINASGVPTFAHLQGGTF